jgi:hypothetical protein
MTSTSISQIPFNGQVIEAQKQGDRILVALKPLCENIGVEYTGQLQRLKKQPWSTMGVIPTVAADGKQRDMSAIDRKTFTMWLATIDTNRLKNEIARDNLVAYQREAADALDRYFNTGVAVNEHLLNAQHLRRMQNMELLKAAEGLIHPDFLEAKARIVLARETGEVPELDPSTRPLYVQDYLGERGIKGKALGRMAGNFGKTLKKLYIARRGVAPDRADITTGSGQIRKVYAYTEFDRALFDQTWAILNNSIGKAA